MEELSFGGVVQKYHRDLTHPKVHYPTNFQTPKSKTVEMVEEMEELLNGGIVKWRGPLLSMVLYSF